ncbi:MAG: EF-P lysine aminoacylase EpmA [Magnetococcus sp. YQC-3]
MWSGPNSDMTAGDSWRPAASWERLRQRARLLHAVRAFFHRRGVWEVETPHLLPAVTPERHLEPIACQGGFLHTSPESCMKRLLAAGSGPIYQICHVFRGDECGVLHSPEFTLLEWYRPGWSMQALMTELEALVQELAQEAGRLPGGGPTEIWSYRDALQRFAGVDPFQDGEEQLRAACRGEPPELDRDGLLDLLLVQRVEPELQGRGGTVFLVDFPPSAAAMARIDPGPPAVARRFELYWQGVELANGYQELTDPVEQRRRLLEANRWRQQMNKPPLPIDEAFLQGLEHGLPECSGVAVGLDRLFMLLLGAQRISEVMAFPFDPFQTACRRD